jgi:uncharacterized membrane protein SirB2
VFIDTLLKLIAGFTVLVIFIAVSQIVSRYQNNAGILSSHQRITPFLVFTVLAFTNLYLWAISIRMLNPPEIVILYLVSGVGILIITIVFFAIAFLKQRGKIRTTLRR